MTLYSMGLRLGEATSLQVRDILSDRGLVHIHGGKGALSNNNAQWLPSRKDLFVHTKPLEIIFKAKFKDARKYLPLNAAIADMI